MSILVSRRINHRFTLDIRRRMNYASTNLRAEVLSLWRRVEFRSR